MKKYKELMITTIVCLIPMAIGAFFMTSFPLRCRFTGTVQGRMAGHPGLLPVSAFRGFSPV